MLYHYPPQPSPLSTQSKTTISFVQHQKLAKTHNHQERSKNNVTTVLKCITRPILKTQFQTHTLTSIPITKKFLIIQNRKSRMQTQSGPKTAMKAQDEEV
ncbi:hypothetical protein RND81_09G003400 [Saponaria officinalis]|uniref:Uncharacterized protein n=1 Tax=Saponaria officinalis TaxID=3572 RepID=A0AAW1IGU9_SAPOF